MKQALADAIAEIQALEHDNRVYWRVMLDDEPRFIVVEMQPFDEPDYDQDRFLTGRIYDEGEANDRAAYANFMMPPHLRTLDAIRLLRRVTGR